MQVVKLPAYLAAQPAIAQLFSKETGPVIAKDNGEDYYQGSTNMQVALTCKQLFHCKGFQEFGSKISASESFIFH